MAELIWQQKHNPYAQGVPSRLRVETCERFPGEGEPAEGGSEGSLVSGGVDLWENRLIYGDKGQVLAALLAEFAGAVDLIYIDPPFMTERTYRGRRGLAYDDRWQHNLDAYLQWLYETFLLLYRLLAPHGSLYVHLDWRTVHFARLLLDEVFRAAAADGGGFQNEIIWHYHSGGRPRRSRGFARKHDTLLLYTRSRQYCFHGERVGPLRGSERRNHMRRQVEADGRVCWTIRSGGRLYRYYADEPMTPADVWCDISHLHQRDPERNGYATQKPAALLERIVLASSEVNDLVLDCFCGSGVTPAVAERLGRRWIACDGSPLAIEVTRERLLQIRPRRAFCLQRVVALE
uniref:Site-specific DNA-methyltransferase n=1 Tax=Thermogemmatispora argillosa TaxID=2045280 RepID=A0A455T9F3_9CHLR|nr:site-specific DNA-methyltransferase [Thermogemmatispora argillosa]